MHHVENNGAPRDLSSTERFKRDNLLHFIVYWLRFAVGSWVELPLYAARTRRWRLCAACLATECAYLGGVAWLYRSARLMGQSMHATGVRSWGLLRLILVGCDGPASTRPAHPPPATAGVQWPLSGSSCCPSGSRPWRSCLETGASSERMMLCRWLLRGPAAAAEQVAPPACSSSHAGRPTLLPASSSTPPTRAPRWHSPTTA